MQTIFPKKIKLGNSVQIVASSKSLTTVTKANQKIANQKLKVLGLNIIFGKHVNEIDEFSSSSIESRVNDLHDAFRNPKVKAIFAVRGGFNSNQLLRYLDWNLIKNNPKIFCGYSDITALNNAIYTKTGLVNYSGPAYSSFGEKLYFEYTLDYFKKCLFESKSFKVIPSKKWSDDSWPKNQMNRKLINNYGYWVINEGSAKGTILGGNLCTFNLLQGTEYFPNLKNSILFLEDDEEVTFHDFDRDLQSIIHLPSFSGVKGIVIGRFQRKSKVNKEIIIQIIKSKAELGKLPVIANVDFGHTQPKITFPIGGLVKIIAVKEKPEIEIIKH